MNLEEYKQKVRTKIAEDLAREDQAHGQAPWSALTDSARASYLAEADSIIATVARQRGAADVIAAMVSESTETPLRLDVIWCYADNEDDEQWRGYCETREQAIDEGARELDFDDGGSTFYIGRYRRAKASDYVPDATHLLEIATEHAIDDGFDESDEIDATAEAKAELDEFLEAWAAKHVDPMSFYVPDGRPERVTVPTPEAP